MEYLCFFAKIVSLFFSIRLSAHPNLNISPMLSFFRLQS